MIIQIIWNKSLIRQEISFFVINNFVYNTSSGRFKFVNYYTNGTKLILLLDTGASISIVKEEALPRAQVFQNTLVVNGIGGKVYSSGYVMLDLDVSETESIQNKFHVFKRLPIVVDGILGLDFMSRYKANINLDKNVLTLQIGDKYCSLPLYDQPDYSNSLLIPPRSETIHYIHLNSEVKGDCFVTARELEKDVFLAGAMVRPKNKTVPIKILNTRDEEVRLNDLNLNVESLEDYHIFKFSKHESSLERANTLLPLLELGHLNKEEKNSIEKICSKYSDTFFLPGDRLETTNICEE